MIGAAILAVSVPVLRPMMLYIGTPELLAIVVLGLSLVATLSGGTPLKGLAAACIGLLVATTGEEPQTGEMRWTFDSFYLYDGLPIVPLALGLFALPELAEMAIARSSISGDMMQKRKPWEQFEGVKDVFKNWFLVLRCSAIGSTLGAVPGIGASVIDWIAYGHAARTCKGADKTFGKGDVRGVIASESANNAKEGGALVPTIAFGVPGSASMTLLLGAFLIHGITPGPKMLTTQLDVTYTLVWSVAIANILGAGICFLFANQLARIALVRSQILVPVVLAITFIGAFEGSRDWGDLYALLIFGMVGWVMKINRWPRPPLVLGFVLGALLENYMFISVTRYGFEWMTRPIVVVLFAVTLFGILKPIIKGFMKRRQSPGAANQGKRVIAFQKNKLNMDTGFGICVLTGFAAVIYGSWEWEFAAKLVPQTVGWSGLIFTLLLLVPTLFLAPESKSWVTTDGSAQVTESSDDEEIHFDIQMDYGDLDTKTIFKRAAIYFGWCIFYIAIANIIGLLPALFVFLVSYLRFEGKESWPMTFMVSTGLWIFSYGLFHVVLLVPWPDTLVGSWFPGLRSIRALALF